MQVINYENGSYCIIAPYYENTVTAFFNPNRLMYDFSMVNKQGRKTFNNASLAIDHFKKIGYYLKLK